MVLDKLSKIGGDAVVRDLVDRLGLSPLQACVMCILDYFFYLFFCTAAGMCYVHTRLLLYYITD